MLKNFLILLMMVVTTLSYGQREIKDQSLILNNGTDRNVTIEFNLGLGANNPKYRFNASTDVWEFTHDGTTWQTMVGLDYTNTQLALKAPLASPTFTGTPAAPTATAGDNDTSLATTAFVTDAVATSATADDARLDTLETTSADHETRLDTIEADTTLTDHIADTSAHGVTGNVVGTTDTQTLSSKTISADSNTISDIDVGELKSGVLDADLGGVSASHDTLPSAKAVKDYVDPLVASGGTALANHLSDTSDAHDASAISSVASGNLVAGDVQAALNELQGDSDSLDGRLDTIEGNYATDTELATHEADTSTHGVNTVAGLTEVQTFTNKTLTSPVLNSPSVVTPSRSDVKQGTEAALTTYAATATNGQIVFATDTKVMYQIVDNALVPVGSGDGEASNLLVDGDFEESDPTDAWTVSPSPVSEILEPFQGEQHFCYTLAGGPLEISQDVATNAGAFADGGATAIISTWYKSNITDKNIYMCPRKAGAITDDCVLFNSDDEWSYASQEFELGGTSNGFSIHSEDYANVASGTICVDKAKLEVKQGTEIGTYQEEDTEVFVTSALANGSTNSTVPYFSTASVKGDAIEVTSTSVLGTSFRATRNTYCEISGYLSTTISTTAYTVGVTKNSTQLSTSITAITDSSIKFAARDSVNTATTVTKLVPFVWSGPLVENDVLRVQTDGQTPAGGQVTVSCPGSLKAIQVNKNQKIKLPSSEAFLQGASTRGSTDTVIVRYDTVSKLRGDGITVTSNATNGTYIRFEKDGFAFVHSKLFMGSSSGFLTLNQTNLTSTTIPASEILSGYQQSTSVSPGLEWVGTVKEGDIIRVATTTAPAAQDGNSLSVLFVESEVAVSVSNTQPQFSDSDVVMRAAGNSSDVITASSEDIVFTTTYDSTGSWDGDQYTIPSDGVYSINVGTLWSPAATTGTMVVYVNGSAYRSIGPTGSLLFYSGILEDSFTQGQVISIRHTGGGTLSNNTQSHYLTITKVGKPNVTDVDVTPFVEVPVLKTQTSFLTNSTSFSAANISGALTDSAGEGLYTYNSSTGVYTALQNIGVTINASVRASSATAVGCAIYINEVVFESTASPNLASRPAKCSASGKVLAGQTFRVANTAAAGTDLQYVSVLATATPDTVVSTAESFNSDTASFVHKTSAVTSSDPVGTFSTFSYTINTNTRAVCATAPTQTVADMNTNGIQIFARAYNAASTCGSPSAFAIQIGKNYKNVEKLLYKSAGKTTPGSFDRVVFSTTLEEGLSYAGYDETTGILYLDAGGDKLTTNTVSTFLYSDQTAQTNGYAVISASKNAQFITDSQGSAVRKPGHTDVVRISYAFGGAGSLTSPTVCSSTPCTEYSDKLNAIAAPTRASSGVYQIIVPNGTFKANSLVTVDVQGFIASAARFECGVYNNGNQTIATNASGGFTIGIACHNVAATPTLTDGFATVTFEAEGP